MEKENFSIRDRLRSFKFAFNGIKILFKNEHNARIHFAASIVACTAGIICKISNTEWALVILCIAAVISLEMINSSIEALCDHVTLANHPSIKTVKDLAAGAVLFSAIISVIVAAIIFIPKIISHVS